MPTLLFPRCKVGVVRVIICLVLVVGRLWVAGYCLGLLRLSQGELAKLVRH